jgi:hypothetical protein
MDINNSKIQGKQAWVEPEIRELDVQETFAAPKRGSDVGGNPYPDCQLS